MKEIFEMHSVLGGLGMVLVISLVIAQVALIFAPEAKRRKRKKCCVTIGALATLFLVLAMLAENSIAQSSGWFRRVPFQNSYIPTAYKPYLIYTNNGTNSGYSAPVTVAITNTTIWYSSYTAPTNNSSDWIYIGKDFLPGVPVTLILGIYAPSGTNGYFTNYLTMSPDGNYWYPSNQLQFGGQLTSGTTNWFYYTLPATFGTNIAYLDWDGIFSSQTNGVTVVWWGYQVPHPTF